MNEITPLARALGRLPSGLFILTTGTGDNATGLLASFVQQVGFEPPVVAVAVHRDRAAAQVLRSTQAFCLSVLSESSKDLLTRFARGRQTGQPAFEGLATELSEHAVPYLADAHAFLACKLVGEVSWSDHHVFCGEVVGGDCMNDEEPLVHIRKNGLYY